MFIYGDAPLIRRHHRARYKNSSSRVIRSEHLHKSCPPLATARGSLATGWLLAAREVVRRNRAGVIKNREVVVKNREVVIKNREVVVQNRMGVGQHRLAARKNRLAVVKNREVVVKNRDVVVHNRMGVGKHRLAARKNRLAVVKNREVVVKNRLGVGQMAIPVATAIDGDRWRSLAMLMFTSLTESN